MNLPIKKLESQARACSDAMSRVLWETLACRRPADRALRSFLSENRKFGSRDRRLISESVFSTLRWWGWLRRLAPKPFATPSEGGRSSAPPPRTRTEDWAKLLLGAQLLEDSEHPPVCRVWCRQAKLELTILSRPQSMPVPHNRWKRLEPLFSKQDMPEFVARDLLPRYATREMDCPQPFTELVKWLQRRPPVWLRVQRTAPDAVLRRLRAADLDPTQHEVMRNAISLTAPKVNLRTLGPFKNGLFEVQDLGSQVIGLVCGAKPGQRWWDACAGAGGKAMQLADLMGSKGSITATDMRTYKLDDLRKRAKRAHYSNIRCREWKGGAPPGSKGGFDGVLVDAPCSCSGTWRRNPDGRWTTSREDMLEQAELQLRLLSSAARGVRPNGVLVYATCSMFRRENMGVVEAFLADAPGFALDPFANPMTGEPTNGTLQIWPWDGDSDSMFVARFRRTSE